eukprot:2038984-Rhodomonas_salina.2
MEAACVVLHDVSTPPNDVGFRGQLPEDPHILSLDRVRGGNELEGAVRIEEAEGFGLDVEDRFIFSVLGRKQGDISWEPPTLPSIPAPMFTYRIVCRQTDLRGRATQGWRASRG